MIARAGDGLDKFCDETGQPYEARCGRWSYLMTARKHGLPVQFNVFAFLPDFCGVNAFLDPERCEENRLGVCFGGTVSRHPLAGMDFINEPSIFAASLDNAREHDGVDCRSE